MKGDILRSVSKKFGTPKVKIVPPRLWPSLFLTIGVYDVVRDMIFIKGGLSKITFCQTSRHEKAHRKWFLHHPHVKEFYNFFYWKPALYYILSTLSIILYLSSVSFWWGSILVIHSLAFFLLLVVFHYCLHIALEIPAGVSLAGLSKKEVIRLTLVPNLSLLPLLLIGLSDLFDVLSLNTVIVLLGLGFFWIWIHQLLHRRAIKNLGS